MLSSNTGLATASEATFGLTSTTRAILSARRTLESIVGRLEHRANQFESVQDSRCVFARAYASMTRRIADSLAITGFSDPEWIAEIELRMADAYFRALSETTPRAGDAWTSVFEADELEKTSVHEALVLGMTTHFVHDLPLALCETGLTARSGKSRLADYHALNDVVSPAVEDIQREIASRYEKGFNAADRLSPQHAAVLTNQGVRIARATAWYNAQRLLDNTLQENALASIRRWPQITLSDLLHPRALSSHMMTRGARVMSRWARRWPQAHTVRR
jgi:Family of unknown function (DUF5995)